VKDDNKNRNLSDFARYSNMGFQMLAIILLGVFAGYKLDQWLGMKFKVFTIIFTISSVFVAMYHAIKDLLNNK
jgi:F0F1-type ATP synthase assembly protein I